MTIIGAGFIGCKYVCIFSSLGVQTTLIHGQHELLTFLGFEIQEGLRKSLIRAGISLVILMRVVCAAEDEQKVSMTLDDGETIA